MLTSSLTPSSRLPEQQAMLTASPSHPPRPRSSLGQRGSPSHFPSNPHSTLSSHLGSSYSYDASSLLEPQRTSDSALARPLSLNRAPTTNLLPSYGRQLPPPVKSNLFEYSARDSRGLSSSSLGGGAGARSSLESSLRSPSPLGRGRNISGGGGGGVARGATLSSFGQEDGLRRSLTLSSSLVRSPSPLRGRTLNGIGGGGGSLLGSYQNNDISMSWEDDHQSTWNSTGHDDVLNSSSLSSFTSSSFLNSTPRSPSPRVTSRIRGTSLTRPPLNKPLNLPPPTQSLSLHDDSSPSASTKRTNYSQQSLNRLQALWEKGRYYPTLDEVANVIQACPDLTRVQVRAW